MNRTWTSAFFAAASVSLVCGLAGTANAASLGVVDVIGSDPDGSFEKLVPVSPGIYGLEARGGRQGRQDWEIGVGTQTSNRGTFNENKLFDDDWGDGSTFYDLVMSWNPGELVSVTIGDTTVDYEADWEVGNAVEILAKGSATFNLTSLDGIAFDETVGEIGGQGWHTPLFLSGDSLLDGWTLEGQIAMTGGGGSRHGVSITSGTFTPADKDAESVPEPASLLGILAIGAVAASKQLKSLFA